jgi:hypothetical protein
VHASEAPPQTRDMTGEDEDSEYVGRSNALVPLAVRSPAAVSMPLRQPRRCARAHTALGPQRLAASCLLAFGVGVFAQAPELDTLLERLSGYLETYEQTLREVVADEDYQQRITRPLPRRPVERDPTGLPIMDNPRPSTTDITLRRLHSTISFMRLPGGAAWLGTRAVRSVDKRAMRDGERLLSVLRDTAGDVRAQAAALVEASIRHNLGRPRSLNMPTLPLELLDRRHRNRLAFQLSRHDTIRGVRTARISFVEKAAPTNIKGRTDSESVISRGLLWIDMTSGALWRAQVFYRDYQATPAATAPEGEIYVEFTPNAALGILVPAKMRETFLVDAARGEGEAKYSNYRRFTTAARVLPQR